MMTIKVNLKDDSFITRINTDLKEIAKYYFSRQEVESIDILEGGIWENEYIRLALQFIRQLPNNHDSSRFQFITHLIESFTKFLSYTFRPYSAVCAATYCAMLRKPVKKPFTALI